jgi:hypothetical protein
MRHVEPDRTPTARTPHTWAWSPMTDLTEDDEFNLLLDDEWDVDPPMRRTTTQKPDDLVRPGVSRPGDRRRSRHPSAGLPAGRRARVDIELANGRALSAALVASDPSIEPALEPVQLFECIGERGSDVGCRFAVQTLSLDQAGTRRGVSERPSKVPSGLGMIVGALPTATKSFVITGSPAPDSYDRPHRRRRPHRARVAPGHDPGRRDCGQPVVRP